MNNTLCIERPALYDIVYSKESISFIIEKDFIGTIRVNHETNYYFEATREKGGKYIHMIVKDPLGFSLSVSIPLKKHEIIEKHKRMIHANSGITQSCNYYTISDNDYVFFELLNKYLDKQNGHK